MKKEDALKLMESSNNINEWNINRYIIIQSFQGKEQREFSFVIDNVKYIIGTSLPEWFFSIINSGNLCKNTVGGTQIIKEYNYRDDNDTKLYSYLKNGKIFYSPCESTANKRQLELSISKD